MLCFIRRDSQVQHGIDFSWPNAAAPAWAELFNEISSYIVNLRRELEPSASDPATKKRKLGEGLPIQPKKEATDTQPIAEIANGLDHENDESLLQVKEISMVVPLRKKFTIEFTKNHIQARDPKTDEVVPGTTYSWKDISQLLQIEFSLTALIKE